ncbi:MAG TPA: sulfatase-like hydrolase/transferase [Thermoanaerobaculia bacterium]|nr:sulfatase-like hydrolase/transferase [Thermoanaerobaculia bacterium]
MRRIAVALLALALFTVCGRRETASSYEGAPIIVISIDTLRADRLPMYGYRDGATPHLDALRRDGILFTAAYSQVPLTLPSHATILTGLHPPHHGVRNNIGYTLDPRTATLPSLLRQAGYATGAAVSSYVLRGSTGLASSFDFYDDAISGSGGSALGHLQRGGETTAAIAKTWIAGRQSKPFFFFLHLFEPHSPYEPPEPYRSRFATAYDGEIAAADAAAGNFLGELKKLGIYDRAVIVLLSDHGEGLSEHGEAEHGIFLYREAIHVPLVIKLPKNARAGQTIDAPAALADVMPSLLQLAGIGAPEKLDGVPLLGQPAPNRNIYSETLYPRIHLGWSELRSLHGPRFHFIEAPRPELYDTQRDRRETTNVLAAERRVFSELRKELAAYGTDVAAPANIEPEEAKKLAALGYLGSVAATGKGPLPDPKDRIGDIATMGRASALSRAGRHGEAIAALRDIVARNPGFTDAWNQLAVTLDASGRLEESAEAYRSAIRQSPAIAGELGLSLAAVLLRLERYDDAAQHARLAEKTNRGNAHLMLARIALARKDHDTATREAREAQQQRETFIAASVVLAQILAELGNAAEALRLLDQAEARAKSEGAAPVESLDSTRGDTLARMERFAEAIAAFRRNIAAFPRDGSAYSRLAVVYAITGRPNEARALLAELLHNNPTPEARRLVEKTRGELGL